MVKNNQTIESKDDRYNAFNPVSRILVRRFFSSVCAVTSKLKPHSVLDIGCGEGLFLRQLQQILGPAKYAAVDVDPDEVAIARQNLPFAEVNEASVYDLPVASGSFDLVLCMEVLEHLADPEKALEEIWRVASEHVVLSVPRDPVWRVLNMVRGKYWMDLGNTPGHVNLWTAKTFVDLVSTRFQVEQVIHPLPWLIVKCRKN